MKITLLTLLCCLICLSSFAQQDGKLDTTFNKTGLLTIEDIGSHAISRVVIALPYNKFLVGGLCGINRSRCFAVVKYQANGSLDSSFGEQGTAIIDSLEAPNPSISCFNMALQSDGKILIVSNIWAARIDSNGNADMSFGFNGRSLNPTGVSTRIALALQPDGKFVTSFTPGSWPYREKIMISRFKVNGDYDSTFGKFGTDTVTFAREVYVGAIAIQSDGKVLCTGGMETSSASTSNEMLTLRLKTNGVTDSTFGSNGFVITDKDLYGVSNVRASGLVLQPDGKFIIGVRLYQNVNGISTAALRYKSGGQIDSSYGTNGQFLVTPSPSPIGIDQLMLQPDGKLLACGYIDNGARRQYVLIRVNPSGQFDSAFGNNGMIMDTLIHIWPNDSPPGDFANSLAVTADGHILSTVTQSIVQFGYGPFDVCAYDSSGLPMSGFGTAGKVSTAVGHSTADYINYTVVLPNKKLLIAGSLGPAAIMTQRNADGTIDTAFGNKGIVVQNHYVFQQIGIVRNPNGKIYFGYRDGDSLYVSRYLSNGQPDISYGFNGTISCYFRNPNQIYLQPDGKLLVMGKRYDTGYTIHVRRFRTNGQPDLLFGSSGIVNISFGVNCSSLYPGNMIMLKNGKILVSASVELSGFVRYYIGLTRLKQNGLLDTGFGNAGQVKLDPVGRYLYYANYTYYDPVLVKEDSQGRLILNGMNGTYPLQQIFIARYDSSCRVDSSFGLNGLVFTSQIVTTAWSPMGNGYNSFHWSDMLIQPDNKILIGGYTLGDNLPFNNLADSVRFALLRYKTDGSPDSSFGNNGMATTSFMKHGSAINTIALTYDGKVVAAGSAYGTYSQEWAIARYYTGLPPMDTPVDNGEPVDSLSLGFAAVPQAIEASFYPNPLISSGTLSYRLSSPSNVRIKLYDMDGRIVGQLPEQVHAAGRYQVTISMPAEGRSGTYLILLETDNGRKAIKILRE